MIFFTFHKLLSDFLHSRTQKPPLIIKKLKQAQGKFLDVKVRGIFRKSKLEISGEAINSSSWHRSIGEARPDLDLVQQAEHLSQQVGAEADLLPVADVELQVLTHGLQQQPTRLCRPPDG